MQTFLVVKGRNLQLSNKSLRLNPFCDWLQRATWHTLYEHELYAVVYSLVLPLYQQQTKLGRRNVFFLYSNIKNTLRSFWHRFVWYSSDFRLPDRGIFGTVAASTRRCLPLSFPEAIKPRLREKGACKPAWKDFSQQTTSPSLYKLLIAEMWRQPKCTQEMCAVLIFPTRHRDPSAAVLDHSEATSYGEHVGVRLHISLVLFLSVFMVCVSMWLLGWNNEWCTRVCMCVWKRSRKRSLFCVVVTWPVAWKAADARSDVH